MVPVAGKPPINMKLTPPPPLAACPGGDEGGAPPRAGDDVAGRALALLGAPREGRAARMAKDM